MDIVWLSHFIPYPPRGGASQRSFNLLKEAAKTHRVFFYGFNRPFQDARLLRESRNVLEGFCQKVEFWELPFPWKGIEWWGRLALSPFSRWPISCQAYYSKSIARRWSETLESYTSALVHFDSGDLARLISPALRFPILLNHHNCESAMAWRRALLERNLVKKSIFVQQAKKLTDVDTIISGWANLNVTVSEEDARRLKVLNPAARVEVVENGTDTSYFQAQPQLKEKNTIVFASSLRWYPNQSALRFFDREIWPLVKLRCPGIRFIVAGQSPPPYLIEWARSDPAVEFVPNPSDIRPCIARGTVYVCPIVDGGGSRLKLLDAMAMGKVIVSTSIGAEGLQFRAGEHMLIADDPVQFAQLIVELLSDPARCNAISIAARDLAVRQYSWPVIGRQLLDAYENAMRSGIETMS